jgi:hypothetical protein
MWYECPAVANILTSRIMFFHCTISLRETKIKVPIVFRGQIKGRKRWKILRTSRAVRMVNLKLWQHLVLDIWFAKVTSPLTIYLVHHFFFVQLASICLGHVSIYLSKSNYHMGSSCYVLDQNVNRYFVLFKLLRCYVLRDMFLSTSISWERSFITRSLV